MSIELYDADQELQIKERDWSWQKKYHFDNLQVVEKVICDLDLNHPWEKIAQDPLKQALANAVWSTTLACFGPQLSTEHLVELNKIRYGPDYAENPNDHVFTSNHLSLSCQLKPLDSKKKEISGPTLLHHLPTFATVPGGKPVLGDISPVGLSKTDGKFVLGLGNWQKEVIVLPAAQFTTELIGSDDSKVPLKTIASPCVSAFQVTILRPDCQEDCLMCTVSRGQGEIPPSYKEQVSQALEILIDHAAAKQHAFQQTLSGGSLSFGDGGFATAHAWGLELIAEKIDKFEKIYKTKIPVQLQLEMVLPPDKHTWPEVFSVLNHYLVLDWKISLAVNMEVLHEQWERLFLLGKAKGVSTIVDHYEFANELKLATRSQIQINSLVMFGLKPIKMTDAEYLIADLKALPELVSVGIKPNYQPVKIENKTKLEAYPPPKPIQLLVQDLALKALVAKHKLPIAPGCVGGCNACDQSHETLILLREAKKQGIWIPDLVKPILTDIGSDYQQAYNQFFIDLNT